jgi:hypothetical protein
MPQLFMPTLDEELAFRGIALALLEREFGQSAMSCRLRYTEMHFEDMQLMAIEFKVSPSAIH